MVAAAVQQRPRRFDHRVDFDPFDDTWHIDDDNIWQPEEEINEDPILITDQLKRMPKLPKLKPSQFTSFAFYMPADDGVGETGLGYSRFSFEGRRHMERIYDTSSRRILLKCARQVEKCCSIESMILMEDGSRKQAGDVRVGDRVVGLETGGSTLGSAGVVWVSPVRKKQSFRIKTRQGHETVVAGTHPIRTWDSWTEAKSVSVGDRIAVVRRAGDFFVGSTHIPEAWVKLCAYLVADGGVGSGYICFTQKPGPVLDEFRSLLVGEFQASTKEYDRKSSTMIRLSRCPGIRRRLEDDGLWGKKSGNKTLPSWVYRISPTYTELLLNRLWACDGHVKENSRSKYSIEYCSMSQELVRQIQTLLWKLGIPSKIRRNWPNTYKKRGEKKYAYILRVETRQGAYMFFSRVGALGKVGNIPLPDLEVPERSNRDTLPVGARSVFEAALPDGRSLRSLGLVRFPSAGVTQNRLRTWIDTLRREGSTEEQLALLESWVHPDVFWDEVVEAAKQKDEDCVDFEVSGLHSFVCDGIITHNSTYLANRAICYMSIIPSFKVLYVSPSATQTTTFSNDRVKDPIETSPILKRFTTTMLSSNILEKQFINRSKITMRYAFLNADRSRGIPAWMLEIDEFQDIFSDNIPVIEQCLSHAPEIWKQYIYAGTPKSLDNNIEAYWSGYSTQNEWAVPHDCKMGGGGRYWNILGERNIGKKGLICANCGTLINAMHPDAQWARMVMEAPFEGYRIPQLMVPWKSWEEILLDYKRYPRDRFYNEVLGISYDSGLRPLTRGQVKDCCRADLQMGKIEKYRPLSYGQPVFAGVDWGTGENSYTVICLGTYIESVFRIFFIHRFEGEDVDPPRQLARIDELIRFFNVKVIGADYGGGYDRNDHLVRQFGPKRLQKFQYMANFNKKVAYDPKFGRWKLARTEVMSDVFNAIKRTQRGQRIIEFPCWEEFNEPYAQDMLNIFSEYNQALRKIQYKHSIDKPDDAFHAILYCWLGSMVLIPRPDIIAPVQEIDGVQQRGWHGPVDQG